MLLALHEMFPDAPLFTAVYDSEKAPWAKVFPKVIPSFLQKVPFAKGKHEFLGTFTPLAFETFNFDEYGLVISVTSEAAKGIITKPGTLHICFCLTPTRYLWSHYDFYFEKPPDMFKVFPFFKYISKPITSYLKAWDKIAAQRPDIMISQSKEVQKRIKKYYNRDTKIINPPTEIKEFESKKKSAKRKVQEYYLYVSRLIPYKRPDLAVEAFNELGLPLVVVGSGSEEEKLKKIAKDNVKFVGEVKNSELAGYYREAKALIFPGEEDFGLVMVEAQAAGVPVVAFRGGGALDTVIDGETGLFFDKQTVKSMSRAIVLFNKMSFNREEIVKNAKRFSKERFKREILQLVNESLKQ